MKARSFTLALAGMRRLARCRQTILNPHAKEIEVMGIQPAWWTEQHGTRWNNLKGALERDWEQTKKDLHLGGKELHQTVGDTLKQAGGTERIPPWNATGTASGSDLSWREAEEPLMYGVGARQQYGMEYVAWNDRLEATLKSDWERSEGGARKTWNEVKDLVRHGYEHAGR